MRYIFLLIVILLLVSCSSPVEQVVSEQTLNQDQQKIKIGVSSPITGFGATMGQYVERGISLALERLPEEERSRVELIFEDDQCSPRLSVDVAYKLVTVDGVNFVLGPFCSATIISAAQYYDEHQVLRLNTGLNVGTTQDSGKYHFTLLGDIKDLMLPLANYTYLQGKKKVAILFLDDDYGREHVDYFEQYFELFGGTIVGKESFNRGENDYRTLLLKLKSKEPDALFVVSIGKHLINIFKQADEIGWDIQKYSVRNTEDSDVISAAGNLTEGIVFPSLVDYGQADEWFTKRYLEKYEEPHEAVAANAFDSFNVLYDGFKVR